ncbi:Stk1 family PASTA domain-containing Ser/Thr kinase [Streptomyces sp. NPDC058457]|uniref:Stk1 family PASTA domain-containing Ser/Thr kinase n=1 Tax=Streptomyces sp. NPDC058457 TaxID=3346507 RepID=UPI00364E20EA
MNHYGPDDHPTLFSSPAALLRPAESDSRASDRFAETAAPAASAAPADRYVLRRLLGRGGMAEVHLAHDTRLDRPVAVKTLRAELARDQVFQARFRREARSTASLNHPAIVAVYDTGDDMDRPYLVMEYVEGATLREVLDSEPLLEPGRALEFTADVLKALAYSHRHGIVHRDIKPANVMLTGTGRIKVMDFGIARSMADAGLTQTSAVTGTARYLSPEQALGREADGRSDLYSVGCLLYELLTHRPPFDDETPIGVICRHVQDTPQAPSLHNPMIGPRLDALVLRALEKDPGRRHQSAEDMLAEMETCLALRTTPTIPHPLPDTLPTHHRSEHGSGDGDEDGNGEGEGDGEGDSAGGRLPMALPMALLIAAALAVTVAAAALGWFVLGNGTAVATRAAGANVPDLVGQTVETARQEAGNVGLTVTVDKREPCADQAEGLVCHQTPAGGQLAKGRPVTVVVSTGAPKIEVPDVTDKDQADAARTLEDKGFEVRTRRVDSTRTPGTVLDQNPQAGQQAARSTEITLTVAKAPERVTPRHRTTPNSTPTLPPPPTFLLP